MSSASNDSTIDRVDRVERYPVHVEASLDAPLSRWLWLVKWLLVVPHVVVLFFLWIAYAVLSIAAFFAILFTGRYPRSIFTFNVGVLRWSWRVAYYAYGALGTDRYPPFTLREVADYPARLDVAYPQRLSRGLVLVKWWLLAIPHYIIVAIFVGGGSWVASRYAERTWGWGGGLVGILVLVAAVVLLFTGRYPRPLYDFVLGMDRWVLRVAGYVGLMTDRYPPFRLDMGGPDSPASAAEAPAAPADGSAGSAALPQPGGPSRGWTAGRVVSLVFGSLLALAAAGLLLAAATGLWADRTQRDAGFLTTPTRTLRTAGYAINSERLDLDVDVPAQAVSAESVLGTVRLRVTGADAGRAVFVGIAPQAAADRYLSGVAHATVREVGSGTTRYVQQAGGPPATRPAAARIWSVAASGVGTQTVRWRPDRGSWTVVAMNADASPGVTVRADVGARLPALRWLVIGLFVGGVVLLLVAVPLIAVPVSRAGSAR